MDSARRFGLFAGCFLPRPGSLRLVMYFGGFPLNGLDSTRNSDGLQTISSFYHAALIAASVRPCRTLAHSGRCRALATILAVTIFGSG